MKRHVSQIFASAILLMFVNFMFSNTIFMHVHKDVDGQPVTHSHPYIPSSGHTHTGNSINLISGFNISALTAFSSSVPIVFIPETVLCKLTCGNNVCISYYHHTVSVLRGPPQKK